MQTSLPKKANIHETLQKCIRNQHVQKTHEAKNEQKYDKRHIRNHFKNITKSLQRLIKIRQKIDKKTHPKKNPQKIDFGRGFGLPKPSQNRSGRIKKLFKKTIEKMRPLHPALLTANQP